MTTATFDFNKIERKYFKVVLKDERELTIKMPKKSVYEKIEQIRGIDTENAKMSEMIEAIYGIAAEVLNNTLTETKKITAEELKEMYDMEEVNEFIRAYMEFVSGAKNDPN